MDVEFNHCMKDDDDYVPAIKRQCIDNDEYYNKECADASYYNKLYNCQINNMRN